MMYVFDYVQVKKMGDLGLMSIAVSVPEVDVLSNDVCI